MTAFSAPRPRPALDTAKLESANEIVGVGACRISRDPATHLITYGLGSCIAVTLYDPVTQVGGMLHFMFPESSMDNDRSASNPYLAADSALPLLLQELCLSGALKSRLQASLSGGAQTLTESGLYNIGKRNHLAARKFLWQAGIMVKGEAVGGETPRTVTLEIRTGAVRLRIPGSPETFIYHPPSGINL